MNDLIVLRAVSKIYQRGDQVVKALDGIDLSLPERGMAAIVGPSGSGKSSLLHLMGAMDRPSSGEVRVAGQLLNTLPESGLTAFRCNTVGFVFQSLVTHAEPLAELADQILHIGDGKLAPEAGQSAPTERSQAKRQA